MAGWASATEHAMGGGKEAKPKKEIKHIQTSKSGTEGDHVHVHHHTHPEHHPPETHTTRGDDEMVQHMMANMGTPNQGEDTTDPGSPAAQAAAPAAEPQAAPMPGGAPMPAQAGM